MPELEIAIPRPQRWDVPFGQMTESDVDLLLAIEPFRSIDASVFPPTLPLRGILLGDTRIGHYQAGDVVIREGDYGNSAFLILSGSVRVILESLNPTLLGREAPPRPSWMQAIAQLWQNSRVPETRAENKNLCMKNGVESREEDGTTRVFLQDFPRILDRTGTVSIGPGEIFGELAPLTRSPRSATVLADSRTTLLEIRWQGLRDLMRRTRAIREHIEHAYRANSLRVHLRETPLLKELPAAALDEVAAATVFESYGNFDWHMDFATGRNSNPAERLAAEPLIAAEGDRPTGLLLIRSGFARVSQRHGHGHRILAYLGKGQVFGLAELIEAFSSGTDVPWECSLRAVGYVDVLRIPVDVVKRVVLTHNKLRISAPKGYPGLRIVKSSEKSAIRNPQSEIDSSLLDFLADHRFLNGTETMLINLDRCTRCDDCVRACAATHDGNPRFIRQGPTHDHIMVANACMHCVDPVCMIGCPTGAIARDFDTGTVRINDLACQN